MESMVKSHEKLRATKAMDDKSQNIE